MVASLWPTTNLCGHFWCLFLMQTSQLLKVTLDYSQSSFLIQPACEARQRTYALRALRLLLADSAPTVGRGEDFLMGQLIFFTKTGVTPEGKVEKSIPRWKINRHAEG